MEPLNRIAIRDGVVTDAENMLKIQEEIIEEEDFLLTDSEEFNKTLDDQKHWIKGILQNKREKLLIAEMEGNMAG